MLRKEDFAMIQALERHGAYRFRADKPVPGSGSVTQFWSSPDDACAIPSCVIASVTTTLPVTVTVKDTRGNPEVGLKVYAFSGAAYTGYSATTNSYGVATFVLPQGSYRFRVDKPAPVSGGSGAQFWTSADNACAIPGCASATATTTIPITVTVKTGDGQPQAGLKVYAFTGTTYTGYNGTTDASGNVTFVLLQGSYRFRADKDGKQYWSSTENSCTIPGCTTAAVMLPSLSSTLTRTITYTYDSLYRLTDATYDTGEYFRYTYDAVGNRLTEVKKLDPSAAEKTTAYAYDLANRLITADGKTYTWDANGNMLSDGSSTYVYNHANRLISVTNNGATISFTYNGLGDRLTENATNNSILFTIDINTSFTQVLSDGTNTYLYGNGRISQTNSLGSMFFLGDSIGSVRQLTDLQGKVLLARIYEPYGNIISSIGTTSSPYGFTGENQENDLVFLRARYYNSNIGQFNSKDTWQGLMKNPISFSKHIYSIQNPINLMDPSGLYSVKEVLYDFGASSIDDLNKRGEEIWGYNATSRNAYDIARWALVMADLDAEDGDMMCAKEYHDPSYDWQRLDASNGNNDNCRVLTRGRSGVHSLDLYHYEDIMHPHRDIRPKHYSLDGKQYAEYMHDLPDLYFRSIDIIGLAQLGAAVATPQGFAGGAMYIWDRYGNQYLSFFGGVQISAFGYITGGEGYVTRGHGQWGLNDIPSENEIKTSIPGLCFLTVSAAFIYGFSWTGLCIPKGSYSGYFLTPGIDFSATVSFTIDLSIKDPTSSWDYLDRDNVITKQQVISKMRILESQCK